MSPAADDRPAVTPPGDQPDEAPGLPGFRTWRGLYLCVTGCFIAYVAALAAFGRWFSR